MPLLVDEQVFDVEGPTLFISRCAGCGATHFPPKDRCPDCFVGEVHRVAANGSATLGGFTEVRLSNPALMSPCIVGEVQLSEGPRLYALLDDVTDLSQVAMGMPLVLLAGVVRRQGDEETLGYRFRPT
jgi:uncharacterized OB-fold protein